MPSIDPNMSIKDVSNLEGVKDLPMAIKAKFVSALIHEAKGDHVTADQKLNEAVAFEDKLNAAKA